MKRKISGRRRRGTRQVGAALLALLAVIMMGSAWMLTTRLNQASATFTAQVRQRNAEVLNRAKLALIGYVAAQAAKSYEDNPGALPCPEHAWYVSVSTKEGGAGPSVGLSNPGYGTANCSSIGRYPWRTIGTEKFIDATGEPLWYVVGPTWRKASTSTKTIINSTTTGDLTVDGENVVAIIIAPGAPMNAAAGTTTAGAACTARNQTQTRTTATGTMSPLDYIECYNEAALQFTAIGPSASFNDQIVTLTAADLLPGIEAAIANRIEREIAPLITDVYSNSATWGSVGATLLPLASTFAVASTNANAYAGTPSLRGLLPLSRAYDGAGSTVPCAVTAAPNYCEPGTVAWSATPAPAVTLGNINHYSGSCSLSGTTINCTALGWYAKDLVPATTVTITASANNVGTALRAFNSGVVTGVNSYAATGSMSTSGGATVTVAGTAASGSTVSVTNCGLSASETSTKECYQHVFSVPITLIGDHANIHTLLDSSNDTTGWFIRNKWHLLSYYAITESVGPGGTGSCTSGSDCLRVTHHANDGKQRGIIVLAGRAIGSQDRTSSALSNWFEGANASATGSSANPFEIRSTTLLTNKTFNDRIAVLSSNP
jgi:hypothetical protein